MNVLVLSTIRSGSSLIQRAIAIYMNLHAHYFNKPIIELANLDQGFIQKVYSNVYKQNVLKNDSKLQSVEQDLLEVIKLIDEVDHYLTGRVTYHHMMEYRDDSIASRNAFYKYLNENFHIVQCQRESVFEFALSNCIANSTKLTNTWLHTEKIDLYADLYKNPITVNIKDFNRYLDRYKNFIDWSDKEFDINTTYVYERDMPNLDEFIQNMSCFNGMDFKSWKDMFGMSWQDYNKCHRLQSDIGAVMNAKLLTFDGDKNEKSNNAMVMTQSLKNLPVPEQRFVSKHAMKYLKITKTIEGIAKEKDIDVGISLKLQTLVEKRLAVDNFNECAVAYNGWADKNGYPVISDTEEIINQAHDELKNWYEEVPAHYKNAIKLLN